tara:strand:- start:2775 stop:3440 length:666 start_codon:yes stop_codon:yes gene_type:complete
MASHTDQRNNLGSIAVGLRPHNTNNVQSRILQPYFILKLWISNDVDQNVRQLYIDAVEKHNSAVNICIWEDINSEFDAGFDLFCPNEEHIDSEKLGHKINHMVKCSMNKITPFYHNQEITNNYGKKPVGYYLYPRSSTGTKTPLRLSNSVGIIDSGYRGNIISAFDNRSNTGEAFKVVKGMRAVQICPPDLSYPIVVKLVESETELGVTNRGEGGFGSTGV